MFDFFYGSDSEQYQFYRVPQVLFTDDRFKSISCEAKLLYGFLLDRTSLSKKSKWVDADGKIYATKPADTIVVKEFGLNTFKFEPIFQSLANMNSKEELELAVGSLKKMLSADHKEK